MSGRLSLIERNKRISIQSRIEEGLKLKSCYFLPCASSISLNSRKSLSITDNW